MDLQRTSRSELQALHEAGIRGVRLNLEVRYETDPQRVRAQLEQAAAVIDLPGWCVQVHCAATLQPALLAVLDGFRVPLVLDHCAGLRPAHASEADEPLRTLLALLSSGRVYVKLSAFYRASEQAPRHADLEPLARRLIEARPDRLVWGSDWPHTGGGRNRDPRRIEPFRAVDLDAHLESLKTWCRDAAVLRRVPTSSPIKDVNGLIAAAKARPGKINFGSGGAGTSVHLAGELFKLQTRTDLVHIPYKGSAPAMTDLIGGQIELMFDTATSALPHIKGNKVRAIALAAGQRLRELPGVPTFAEQGVKDFEVPAWYGFVVPAGTPAAAVQWLNAEVNAVLKDPAVVAKLDAVGAIPVGGTPAQMGDFMKSQSNRWAKVIKDAAIKLD